MKKNMQIRTAEENSSEIPRNTNMVYMYQEVDKNINIMKTIPVIIGFWHMYMIFKQILYDILLFLVSYFVQMSPAIIWKIFKVIFCSYESDIYMFTFAKFQ